MKRVRRLFLKCRRVTLLVAVGAVALANSASAFDNRSVWDYTTYGGETYVFLGAGKKDAFFDDVEVHLFAGQTGHIRLSAGEDELCSGTLNHQESYSVYKPDQVSPSDFIDFTYYAISDSDDAACPEDGRQMELQFVNNGERFRLIWGRLDK